MSTSSIAHVPSSTSWSWPCWSTRARPPSLEAAERVELIRRGASQEELGPEVAAGIEVVTFEGLTVDLARQRGATSIVRGLRALSDFENEQAIAHLNRKLAPEIDTVFFMTGLEHAYLSSSLVREIAAFGGDVSAMVPDVVARRLAQSSALTADFGALQAAPSARWRSWTPDSTGPLQ